MVYEAVSLRQIFRSPTSEQKVRISPYKYNRVIAETHIIYMMSHNPSYRIAPIGRRSSVCRKPRPQDHTAADLHGFSTALLQQGLHRLPVEP